MSRSWKHIPGYKDHSPGMKIVANRRVRRAKGVVNYGGYRKLVCSWSISDYQFLYYNNGDVSSWWRRLMELEEMYSEFHLKNDKKYYDRKMHHLIGK